jgi:hypothetical protein
MVMKKTTQIILHADLEGKAERRDGESKKRGWGRGRGWNED